MKINSQFTFFLVWQQQQHRFVLHCRIPRKYFYCLYFFNYLLYCLYCLSANSCQCKLEISLMLSNNCWNSSFSFFLCTYIQQQLNVLLPWINASRSTTWYICKGGHHSPFLVFHSNIWITTQVTDSLRSAFVSQQWPNSFAGARQGHKPGTRNRSIAVSMSLCQQFQWFWVIWGHSKGNTSAGDKVSLYVKSKWKNITQTGHTSYTSANFSLLMEILREMLDQWS